VLLKIAHRGVMIKVMVDSPLDQMSLVRFRAQPFHTAWYKPSASLITVKVPNNVGDSSVYSLVYRL